MEREKLEGLIALIMQLEQVLNVADSDPKIAIELFCCTKESEDFDRLYRVLGVQKLVTLIEHEIESKTSKIESHSF